MMTEAAIKEPEHAWETGEVSVSDSCAAARSTTATARWNPLLSDDATRLKLTP